MSHETRGRFRPHKNDLYLHAAINEAAKLSGAPPGAWIHSRLRACLDIELAQCDSAASKSRRANLLRWAAGQAPLDVTNLRSAKDICDSLSSGVVAQNPTAPRNLDARHQLYDPLAIEAVAARVTEKEHRVHFDALIRSQATRERPVLSRTQENNVRRLAIDAPHLAEATQTVLDAIAIARRAKGPPRLAPILLSGPPASGKSWWARQVAQALGFPATTIVMPKVTASFVLSGSTASWSSARPGRIVEAFIGTRIASPVIIIDEIEKASAARYDPTPVLLDLLDHASASRWHDEFFGVEFDVSSAIFVATCNSPELLDPALRSRFRGDQGPDARCREPAGGDPVGMALASRPLFRTPAARRASGTRHPAPGPDAARHAHAAALLRRRHCPGRAPPGSDPDHSRRPRRTRGGTRMRRYVVLDLEATCDDQGSVPREEMEIIEIGAVLLDPASWRIKEEFNAFVRPVRNPRLTPFCTQLTSITQPDVDPAAGFVEVVAQLQHWLRPFRLTAWGSWGNYDRRQIQQDADFHGIGFPIDTQHFNLKDRFTKRMQLPRRPGLGTALGVAGLAFEGTHHRAIDDARNIARLMPMMYGATRTAPLYDLEIRQTSPAAARTEALPPWLRPTWRSPRAPSWATQWRSSAPQEQANASHPPA